MLINPHYSHLLKEPFGRLIKDNKVDKDRFFHSLKIQTK